MTKTLDKQQSQIMFNDTYISCDIISQQLCIITIPMPLLGVTVHPASVINGTVGSVRTLLRLRTMKRRPRAFVPRMSGTTMMFTGWCEMAFKKAVLWCQVVF